jgi:hypothetical protein
MQSERAIVVNYPVLTMELPVSSRPLANEIALSQWLLLHGHNVGQCQPKKQC